MGGGSRVFGDEGNVRKFLRIGKGFFLNNFVNDKILVCQALTLRHSGWPSPPRRNTPRPPPRALLNTDPHGRVLLRIIQRIILYYSSLSSRSKSSILTEMADVVSVSYLNVARLKLLFENIFIHLLYSSWVCQLFTSCRDSI